MSKPTQLNLCIIIIIIIIIVVLVKRLFFLKGNRVVHQDEISLV
jgi:uncharacterized protein YpmB